MHLSLNKNELCQPCTWKEERAKFLSPQKTVLVLISTYDDIFEAFKTGRAAIVAGDYKARDEQANIIKEKISMVIAIRAVYYLQAGKTGVENGAEPGTIFHDLSEGLGFVNSLQFTRKPNSDESYFTKAEVDGYFSDIIGDINGLWNVDVQVLEDISQEIAEQFDFTVEQAR